MDTVIIYKSKTGFTEQYAKWIAEEIGCDAVCVQKTNVEILKPYKTIIYGGGVIAGQISGLKKFKTDMSSFPEKKFIVFATGAAPAKLSEKTDEIQNANFTVEEKQNIAFFYFQSGINYERMNVGNKLLMKIFTSILAGKKAKTSEEQAISETIMHSCNYSDRKFIEPLVKFVKE